MAKVKLTKGELKRQRDALRQYQRYLPTLQLKKQQLQVEILQQTFLAAEKRNTYLRKKEACLVWSGLLAEAPEKLKEWIFPESISTLSKNIAGTQLPLFEAAHFTVVRYDLFSTPLWVDSAIEALRSLVSLEEEIKVLEEGISILKQELRITTQRVNLFEKVKIPDSQEAIRLIKIYIGDQMSNAVGRSKIAKRKIEELIFN